MTVAVGAAATASGSVAVTHRIGLHARPSVKLTKLAKRHGATIRMRRDEDPDWIDAKSIVKVMALKAPAGARLHFEATGTDADAAVAALVALVRRNFDEPQD